jgi:hypothetical protein
MYRDEDEMSGSMVPNRTDPRWATLVDSPSSFTYQFLALRILMQRVSLIALRAKVGIASAADRNSVIDEVHAFFVKNERLLAVDLKSIFG